MENTDNLNVDYDYPKQEADVEESSSAVVVIQQNDPSSLPPLMEIIVQTSQPLGGDAQSAQNQIQCKFCELKFKNSASLNRHCGQKHKSESCKCEKCQTIFIDSKRLKQHKCSTILKCSYCLNVFNSVADFENHECQLILAEEISTTAECSSEGEVVEFVEYTHQPSQQSLIVEHATHNSSFCAFCLQYRFVNSIDYCNHIRSYHDATFKVERCTFHSAQAFAEWKANLELTTVTYFCLRSTSTTGGRRSGNSTAKNEEKRMHYVCNRCGVYRPKPSPTVAALDADELPSKKRAPKNGFSVRASVTCPAFITAYVQRTGDGAITVVYCTKHIDHDRDPRKIRIPKAVRAKIDEFFNDGKTTEWIMTNLIATSQNPKISSLTQVDLINCLRAFRENLSKNIYSKTKTERIVAIEKTFQDVERSLVGNEHPEKSGVFAVQEMPLFPDYKGWKFPFALINFDSDPTPNSRKPEKLEQAYMSGMVDQKGEQCVGYFVPLDQTLRIQEADDPEDKYVDKLCYKLANTYNWDVKNKTSPSFEQNHFLIFRNFGVYYNEIETIVELSKKRTSKVPDFGLLAVQREQTDAEVHLQRSRCICKLHKEKTTPLP